MSVIKSLKIKQADGTFGEAIDLGAKAKNIGIEGEGSFLDLQMFLRTRPVKYYGSFSDAIFEAQFIPKEEVLVSDPAGEIIVTDGFYTRYDGGAGIYRMIRDTVIHEDATQDENNIYFKYDTTKSIFYFQPHNTSVTFELLVFDNKINIKQIGAASYNSTNNTITNIKDIIENITKSGHIAYIPSGEYYLSNVINLDTEGATIIGEDVNTVIFKPGWSETGNHNTNFIQIGFIPKATIKNITFDGNLGYNIMGDIALSQSAITIKGSSSETKDLNKFIEITDIIVKNFRQNQYNLDSTSNTFGITTDYYGSKKYVIKNIQTEDIANPIDINNGSNCIFENIITKNSEYGLVVPAYSIVNNCEFIGKYAYHNSSLNNTSGGLTITANNCRISNVTISKFDCGIYLSGKLNTFENIILDSNGNTDGAITEQSNKNCGIYIYGGFGNSLKNIYFKNTDTTRYQKYTIYEGGGTNGTAYFNDIEYFVIVNSNASESNKLAKLTRANNYIRGNVGQIDFSYVNTPSIPSGMNINQLRTRVGRGEITFDGYITLSSPISANENVFSKITTDGHDIIFDSDNQLYLINDSTKTIHTLRCDSNRIYTDTELSTGTYIINSSLPITRPIYYNY